MELHLSLSVFSTDLGLDQIVSAIGMAGDQCWKKGDKRENTIIPEKENGWSIKSLASKEDDLESHISSIMDLVHGREQSLKELSSVGDTEVQISCSIYYEGEPPLFFDKKYISWIDSIGASLDIDLYRTGK